MFTDKQKNWIWIKSLHLSISQERRLLQDMPDPSEIFDCIRRKDARLNHLNANSQRILSTKASEQERERAAAVLERNQIGVLLRDDPHYPALLHQVVSPPEVLYYRGNLQTLQKPMLAMVGTRKPSQYGRNAAYAFAREVAMQGVCVVSGLARGIDSQAHRGALDSQRAQSTTAVLTAGLDVVYPPENAALFHSIEQNGILISENPPGYNVQRYSTPQRNRLIAGLAQVLLVVEAEFKSGSRYTVDASLEYGRDVFAVPGRIDDVMAQFPNYLIQLGAHVALEPNDILDAFDWIRSPSRKQPKQTREAKPMVPKAENVPAPRKQILSNKENMVMNALKKEPMTADRLCMELNWPVYELLVYLTKLEQINMIHRDMANHTFQICIS